MKHILSNTIGAAALLALCCMTSCSSNKNKAAKDSQDSAGCKIVDKTNVDFSKYKADKDGFITLFDGKTLTGWRGYGMDVPPKSWGVEDGAIKLKGSGTGEAQTKDGGDLIFAHKFKNFELDFEDRKSVV